MTNTNPTQSIATDVGDAYFALLMKLRFSSSPFSRILSCFVLRQGRFGERLYKKQSLLKYGVNTAVHKLEAGVNDEFVSAGIRHLAGRHFGSGDFFGFVFD